MQYHNPFKIFGISPNSVNSHSLSELKTILEHDFSSYKPHEEVFFRGSKIKLSDLKRIFGELENEGQRKLHEELLTHNDLINFLEYGHLGYFREISENAKDENLMEFIAPYFAFQYSEAVIQAIKIGDKETVSLLSEQKLPQRPELEPIYFYDTEHYLNENLEELAQLKNDSKIFVMSERELSMQMSDKSIEVYNSLPDYFIPIRDRFALGLRAISETLMVQGGRREGAVILLKQALKLKLSEEISKDINSLLKQLSPGIRKLPLFLLLGLGIILLLFLMKWIETTFMAK